MRARFAVPAVVLAAGVAALVLRPWDTSPSPSPIDDGEPTGPAVPGAGLAAKRPAPTPNAAARASGAVVGTVRRGGAAVAARVEVYRLAALDPAVPEAWASDFRGAARAFVASDERPAATTQAGADGAFTLEALGPGEYEVVATAADGARGAARARIAAEGGRASADVEIHAGAERLVGRAVHASGQPFVGEVAATPPARDETTVHGLRFAPTNAEGRFALEGLEAGQVVVIARDGARLYAASNPVSIPRPDEFVFTVDAGLGDLAGRVVADADGSPVGGAIVFVRAYGSTAFAEVRGRAVTDVDGRFRLASPAGDSGRLEVHAAGYATVQRSPPDPLRAVEIRLARVARVTGRVTLAADGAPAAGVDVYAFPSHDVFREGSHATTDEGGRYAMADVAPGERTIFAIGHGFLSKGLEAASPRGWNPFVVDVPAGGAVERDLVVVPAGRVAGKVLDPAGAPVRGAFVRWEVADAEPSEFAHGAGALVLHRDVATGGDGTFLLDAIPAGQSVEVEASAAGFSSGRSPPVVARVAAPPTVEIRLAEPRWLEIRVENKESGAPVVGARVGGDSIRTVGHTSYQSEIVSTTTSADGSARLGPLPAGEVSVTASASGYGYAQVDGDALKDLPLLGGARVLRLRKRLSIAGRAHYADGTPASGGVGVQGLSSLHSAGLGADGEFRVDGLSPGVYRLDVTPIGGEKVSRDIHAGDEGIDVVLPGSKPVAPIAEIVDPEGKPVEAATLWYRSDGQSRESVRDGRAALHGLAADSWIEVFEPTTAMGARARLGAVAEGPIAAGTTTVTIRMPPERTIDGVVLGPDGKGVAAAMVSATPVRPEALSFLTASHDSARADASGRFHLGRLWDGEYRLAVVPPPGFAESAEPVAAKSGATDVRIVLRATIDVAPTVVDWRGLPVPGAEVELQMEDPTTYDSRVFHADADGVVRMNGLDPERPVHSLHAKAPEGFQGVLPLRVGDWKPSSEPLRLPRAFSVSGVVRERDGRRAAGVTVSAYYRVVKADADGRFAFPDAREGEVRIIAVAEGPSARRSKTVTVTAGAEDVVLVMQPSAALVVRLDGFPAGESRTRVRLSDEASNVSTLFANVAPDGTARFEGLDAEATYSLLASVGDPPRLAFRRGVRGTAGELRLALVSGKTIEGRVVFPAGSRPPHLHVAESGVYADADADPDGRYVLAGLPEGTWTVHARARGADGAVFEGQATAEAGGRADLTLAAKK